MPISVYLVDDHPVVRLGLRAFLEREGFVILGESDSGEAAFNDPMTIRADVVLSDVRMKGIDGLDLLQRILAMRADANVILYSGYDNPIYWARAAALGAKGYMLKDQPLKDLADLLTKASSGEISPEIIEKRRNSSSGSRARNLTVYHDVALTMREVDVLKHLANGLTNKEIAISLGIGYETVKEHVQHVLRKLGVTDRTQAAVWAVRCKLV
jgi:DNA-binding NarL/FixJ family response regulator